MSPEPDLASHPTFTTRFSVEPAEGCLIWKEETQVFDPQAMHGDASNPTQL